jgi:hypothetical protein
VLGTATHVAITPKIQDINIILRQQYGLMF